MIIVGGSLTLKNSQKVVVTTKIAPFEQHSDNCRFCMKHAWFSELYFFVKCENKVTQAYTEDFRRFLKQAKKCLK